MMPFEVLEINADAGIIDLDEFRQVRDEDGNLVPEKLVLDAELEMKEKGN